MALIETEAFLQIICAGFYDVVVSKEGFCSAPTYVSDGEHSAALYWIVTNPTLAPVHLEGYLFYDGCVIFIRVCGLGFRFCLIFLSIYCYMLF